MEANKHIPLGMGRWVYLILEETKPTQLLFPNTFRPRKNSTNSSATSQYMLA